MDKKIDSFGKRSLAPIFAKKKPRTALFAHPNNSNSQFGPQQSGQLQNPVFTSKSTTVTPGNLNVQPHQTNDCWQTNYQPNLQYGQSPRNQVYPQTNPANNSWNQGPNQAPVQNNPYQRYGSNQIQPVNRSTMFKNADGFSSTGRPTYKEPTTFNQPSAGFTGQNPPQQQYRPSPSYGRAPSQLREPAQAPIVGNQPYGEPNTPTYPTQTFTRQATHLANTQDSSATSVTQSSQPNSATSKGQDKSLRILSATVEGMVHWSQFMNSFPLMFELIGRIDSAVTGDVKSPSKEFVLRDDKGATVKCVFFEIDRPCPRLIRGQYYRCTGTYNTHKKTVNCVNIRPAVDTERKLHPVLVVASDKAMRAIPKN